MKTKYKHIDTNILLLDSQNLEILADKDTVLVISETVIDELDSKKSLLDELGYNAREFGRLISKAKLVEVTEGSDITVVSVKLNDINIDIVSKKRI